MTGRRDGGAAPLLLFLFCGMAAQVEAHVCNYCVSKDMELTPVLRRQLGVQRDTFHRPVDAASHQCHDESSKQYDRQAQVCVEPFCVTVSPYLPAVNFTVRGCMDQILRHPLRLDARLQKNGCFLRRSKPIYTGEPALNYLLCVCSGELCNDAAQRPYFPIDVDDSTEDIIELVETGRDEPMTATNGNSRTANSGFKPKFTSAATPLRAPVSWSAVASTLLVALLTRVAI